MEPELRAYSDALHDSLRRVIEAMEGLSAGELNWRPPAPEANSLGVLATHVMGNIRQNALSLVCGLPDERDRSAEFAARGDSAEALIARAQALQREISQHLGNLAPGSLDGERTHPRRGRVLVREVLLIPIRHAAEHVGQMDLTRDLARAANVRS